ncbi:MAG: AraC family transcriptional regulator [Pseudomonadota bacterium]
MLEESAISDEDEPVGKHERSPMLADLAAIAAHGLASVASASRAVIARLGNRELAVTHAPMSDLLLIPASPCRISVRVDGGGDQLLRVSPNTLMIFRQGRTYEIGFASCEKMVVCAVDPAWFQEVARRCDAADPTGVERAIDTILHPDIPPIVDALRRHLSSPKSPHERFITLNVELLASHYFWHQATEQYEPPLSIGLSNGLLQVVLEEIERNLDRRILVAELAQAVLMSPSQFSRAFKSVIGVSPQSYILERRVLRVQDLLEEMDLPLVEVAYEAGFSSQAHMTSTFAKVFGITPGEYRKFVDTQNSESAVG